MARAMEAPIVRRQSPRLELVWVPKDKRAVTLVDAASALSGSELLYDFAVIVALSGYTKFPPDFEESDWVKLEPKDRLEFISLQQGNSVVLFAGVPDSVGAGPALFAVLEALGKLLAIAHGPIATVGRAMMDSWIEITETARDAKEFDLDAVRRQVATNWINKGAEQRAGPLLQRIDGSPMTLRGARLRRLAG
jgi:hypothetical protein